MKQHEAQTSNKLSNVKAGLKKSGVFQKSIFFFSPVKTEYVRKSQIKYEEFIPQKFSRRDVRLISCLVSLETQI